MRWTRRWTKDISCRRTAVSVPLKFVREGIRYDELTEEEKDQWDMLEWGEEEPPTASSAEESTSGCSTRTPSTRCSPHLMTERPQGRRRRPARQDHHLRQEPGPRGVHRAALQRGLSASRRSVRPCHHLQDRICADADRRFLAARTRRRTSRSPSTCSIPASTCRRSSTSCSSSWSGRRRSFGR